MTLGTLDYCQVSRIIYESWAEAVQWYITRLEYIDREEFDYDDPNITPANGDHKQWWFFTTLNDREFYTPLFIDMVDDFNQGLIEINPTRPDEDITGYGMRAIERDILKDAYGLTSLRNELLIHRPTGVTVVQIDQYMARYFNEL